MLASQLDAISPIKMSVTFNAALWSQLFQSVGSCDMVCPVNRVLLVLLVLMVCLLLHSALLRTSAPPKFSGMTPLAGFRRFPLSCKLNGKFTQAIDRAAHYGESA